MTTFHSIRKALFIGALGASTGFGISCVLVAGDGISKECGDLGTHSEEAGGECVCEAGYEWCDPNDQNDVDCCEPDGVCPDANSGWVDGLCYCDPDFTWCNPDDQYDLSCCEGDDTGGTGGKGTDGTTDSTGTAGTGGGGECSAGTAPDPSACTTDNEGEFYCTNTVDQGPACSTLYVCEGGAWVDASATAETSCQFDQFDFAYGCVDTGGVDGIAEVVCGFGPGTACDDSEPSNCVDEDQIHWCHLGKLTEDSCSRICQDVGDESGATYDFGACVEDAGAAECGCCDTGDPACEGGTSTSTGGA